ncbi:MAG: spondin domain-containing protein [Gammaproteobacteria bacterium]
MAHYPKSLITFFVSVVIAFTAATAAGSEATYRMTVVNTWTAADFPANFPGNDHWAMLGGGTHDPALSYWSLGENASSQIESMAEGGNAFPLRNQITAAGGSPLLWNYWFCRADKNHPSCGSPVVEFTVDSDTSALTITSMIAPSPDWFIGVDALNLYPDGAWITALEVPLVMYDGGTEEGLIPSGSNPPTSPKEPVSHITYNTATGNYERSVGIDVVGSFTFELLSVDGDLDGDNDGIGDSFDNCLVASNASQLDTDGDGYGNACDADTNNDCVVNFIDLSAFSDAFLSTEALFDFNGDGAVNFIDLSILANAFLGAPGPSAAGSCADGL